MAKPANQTWQQNQCTPHNRHSLGKIQTSMTIFHPSLKPSDPHAHSARSDASFQATVMALGMALLAGCATPPRPAPGPTPAVPPSEMPAPTLALMGTEWHCTRIGTRVVDPGRTPTLLIAADGKASGFAGVNRWFGPCAVDGATVKFGLLGMTRMAGPPERMDLEQAYANALAAVTRWSVTDGHLQLSDGTSVILEFLPAQ